MMKSRFRITSFGSLAALTLLSCSLFTQALNSAINSAVSKATGQQAISVSQLWPNVPPLPGASPASTSLPPGLNLMVQEILRGAYSQEAQKQGGGAKINNMSFTAHTSSDSSAAVASFYTVDRMSAAGWNVESEPGCSLLNGGTPVAGAQIPANLCLFGKIQGQNNTALVIFPLAGQQGGKTQIFYVRLEGTGFVVTATP
ncbi:MAG: hypothetical protein ABSG98_06560 [Anaerolineales bacterium]